MPSLLVFPPRARMPQAVPIVKKITTFGTDSGNDVVIDDPGVQPHHGHILFDGKRFEVSALDPDADVLLAGKRRRAHKLEENTVFVVGDTTLQFKFYDLEVDVGGNRPATEDVFRTLLELSQKLMQHRSVDAILNELLDQVIALTEADRGFILLTESGESRVHVARGIDRRALGPDEHTLSDSIVQRVLETAQPVVLKDALHDREFSKSASVINLRLCSVMCVPLQVRGSVLGLIYVGNDNVVNLFGDHALEVLTIYAAQAGLILRNAMLLNELQDDNVRLHKTLQEMRFGEIIGACPSMLDIYKKIERVATTDISVLILGETGTGKELVAKEIHARSDRVKGPFVVINCGAIPENLLESELFGHVRGAFTGAVATTAGKFQTAHRGTLFLDEIGELPLNLQVKLLRALQEKQVTKVGDTKPEKVDIRIVAATNKNLLEEVRRGAFREDLYYRLNVITLSLPPLRDRGDDIRLIAQYLLKRYVEEFRTPHIQGFATEALGALRRHEWPGNIRELENRVKKAVVFCNGPHVAPVDMDLSDDDLPPLLPLAAAKERFQREYINFVLALNDGNRTQTARVLDVDPRTVFRHLEKERGEDGEPWEDEV
jgi:transcriptional regulator with GAF, ATPase, and Fis domain